jgi:hypothetical protein
MMKIDYKNTCYDCYDKDYAKDYIAEKGTDEWTGTIKVLEKTENCISADVSCRGSQFYVVIGRYFKANEGVKAMGITDSWCVCVPNWSIGTELIFLDKADLYFKFNETIENKVDCISLTNAVWELANDIRADYHKAVEEVLARRNS